MDDPCRIDPDAVLWSLPPARRRGCPLLVLLHGYGADERDLFGLVPMLPHGVAVAAVRAPRTPPPPAPGYSWYPIDDVTGRGPAAGDAARVDAAATGVLRWLDAVSDDVPAVGLLGFSQGASVALQALRLSPDRFACVVVLSGYAAPGVLPRDEELAALRVPVFWGRGSADPVIPPALVEHTGAWLPGHSALSAHVYPGLGHGVSDAELAEVRGFLQARLGGR